MEDIMNNIFADEKFNNALDSMLTMAEYSRIHLYKVDVCSDVIKHILTFKSLYANEPISEEDINKRVQCNHTDENGGIDRILRLVKIDDATWFKCNLCNTLISTNPPSNFAPVVSCVKKNIYDIIYCYNAKCLEKGNDEQMPEIYNILFKDASTMYNITVELKRMLKAKRANRKSASKRNSPINISKTIPD